MVMMTTVRSTPDDERESDDDDDDERRDEFRLVDLGAMRRGLPRSPTTARALATHLSGARERCARSRSRSPSRASTFSSGSFETSPARSARDGAPRSACARSSSWAAVDTRARCCRFSSDYPPIPTRRGRTSSRERTIRARPRRSSASVDSRGRPRASCASDARARWARVSSPRGDGGVRPRRGRRRRSQMRAGRRIL